MADLFDTTKINSLTLDNRFVRSATWEGMAAEDGGVTQPLINKNIELVKGGIGLIITGHSYVLKEGQAGKWQMGIHNDEFISGLIDMTDTVHHAGGKIVMQLAHAGCQTSQPLARQETYGPSVNLNRKGGKCLEMTVKKIEETVQAFADGAERAKKAGFDGVQIHSAHGYLLSQFLSPFYNKRTDAYGGNTEKRTRIVLEALTAIRKKVGADFPVMIKLNCRDFVDGGIEISHMIETASLLESAGIDAIELSGGTIDSGRFSPVRYGKIKTEDQEVYYRKALTVYKENISVPLMIVGGIRSFSVAEKLITGNLSDYISLCRPLIREPALVNRWKSGNKAKAACISCNLCFKPITEGKGIMCMAKEKFQKKHSG